MDLNYLNQVMQEALRFRPSAANSQVIYLTEDCKLGKYNFKKGD